jgi:hypothetical protein
MRCLVRWSCGLAFACASLSPSVASAQWFLVAYLGANHTPPADVTVSVPAENLSLTYRDVEFIARPFASPQYYGARIGRMMGLRHRLGIEVEFIHIKVIGQTSRVYETTGQFGSFAAIDARSPMNAIVQQYQMTHGLNYLLINLVTETPLGSPDNPLSLSVRAGAGPTFPHAESRIGGQSREQYEYGGVGAHAAAGFNVRLFGLMSGLAEYKITFSKPEISVAGGTSHMTALTHQFAFGLMFRR